MTIGLEEAIRYTQAAIRHASQDGTTTFSVGTKKDYFVNEARIIALEKAVNTLKAVHLSVELECPKFRRLYSETLEKDGFIDDKFSGQQRCIYEAQMIDQDAKQAYEDHVEEYEKWLDSRRV